MNKSQLRSFRVQQAREAILKCLGDGEMTYTQINELVMKNHPEVVVNVLPVISGMVRARTIHGKQMQQPDIGNRRYVYRIKPWEEKTLPKLDFDTRLANFIGITDKLPSRGRKPDDEALIRIQHSRPLQKMPPVAVQSFFNDVYYG